MGEGDDDQESNGQHRRCDSCMRIDNFVENGAFGFQAFKEGGITIRRATTFAVAAKPVQRMDSFGNYRASKVKHSKSIRSRRKVG
jgi:hypothetical protein